jgi:DNA polymerase-3 subunit delta'
MLFKEIIGQEEVKQKLITAFNEGRVPHTQLFIGEEGVGALPLAIAFAQYINCENRTAEDSCGHCSSCLKFNKFSHPDLHFVFPTNKPEGTDTEPSSDLFYKEWIEYLQKTNGYALQNEWYAHLKIGKKRGNIYARDANNLIRALGIKSFEANYKVAIIWKAERMDPSPANKLLKTLEEPPENTLIFLIAERYELLLPTIRSRAQLIKIPKIKPEILKKKLESSVDNVNKLDNIVKVSKGNWRRALQLVEDDALLTENFMYFREWLQLCYKIDYPKIFEFVQRIAPLGRERQKSLLQYGLEVVSHCIRINHGQWDSIAGMEEEKEFLKGFAPFINKTNQDEFYKILNEAIYQIDRNINATILFGDLSFSIAELIYRGKKSLSKR